jgi:hypothetical protein
MQQVSFSATLNYCVPYFIYYVAFFNQVPTMAYAACLVFNFLMPRWMLYCMLALNMFR